MYNSLHFSILSRIIGVSFNARHTQQYSTNNRNCTQFFSWNTPGADKKDHFRHLDIENSILLVQILGYIKPSTYVDRTSSNHDPTVRFVGTMAQWKQRNVFIRWITVHRSKEYKLHVTEIYRLLLLLLLLIIIIINLSNISGQHEIKELHNASTLGTAHILLEVLM